MDMDKVTDWHRFELAKIYQRIINRFGLDAWKRHSKKLVVATHKRLNIN